MAKGVGKGKTNNPNGRPKGVPNELTQTAREMFIATIEAQVPSIQAAFDYVKQDDPAKYLELLAKYAQYFVPKQVEMKLDNNIINVIVPNKKSDDNRNPTN